MFDQSHLLPCVQVTGSGINVKSTIERLLTSKRRLRHKDGPAIPDKHGKNYWMRELNKMLHKLLKEIFDLKQDIFPKDVKSTDDLKKKLPVLLLVPKSF